MGHRGQAALTSHIKRLFHVKNLHEVAGDFLNGCLLCPHVKGGKVVQRPFSPTWHATKRNQGIHFDFLFLGKTMNGPEYVLVLKDDLTHYCELVACDSPTSQVCVTALVDWWKRFGMPEVWLSDQGSHFKNVAVRALAHKFKVHHDFSLAYCPWRNGTVERLNRDILQVLRVLLREYKLADHQWDYLLPVVQANLNQTPVPSLANKSPMELFTALDPVTPLDTVVRGLNGEISEADWSKDQVQETMATLRTSLHALHKEVLDKNEARLLRGMARSEGNAELNISEGDYVLWSRVDERRHPKLLVTWIGPYQVVEVNEFSVVIEHLLTKDRKTAHSSRVKLYADASFEVSEEILEHVAEQGILLKVEKITQHVYDKPTKGYLLYVHWEGFEIIEASWEPLAKLMSECPALVRAYIYALKSSDKKILEEAMKASERAK
jgi:hypothetical protein